MNYNINRTYVRFFIIHVEVIMINSDKTIIHFDIDAFFASVEQLDHPEYRGKPLIVGGDSDRSVVSTCSYEADRKSVV